MVMEWMATITGDHVGYPGFQDLGNFSPRRKNFGGAKIRTLLVSNFCGQPKALVLLRLFAGNTKGGSITVLLTSCLTGLELAV